MSGIVFIISAPSGSGKSTLANELRRIVPNLEFSISYTTRPPRGSEQNGREYFFVSREEFERMLREDEFLEYAEVFGNYYGTAKRFLREAFARGHDLLLDIDVQGAAQVKQRCPVDAVSIFILPPSREELERRLRRRAQADDDLQRELLGTGAHPFNTEAIIQRRLQTASREIENFSQYDYILINDRLELSIDILKSIIEAERLKRAIGATPADDGVLAIARQALRSQMMEQVQTILATFDIVRFPTVTE